MYDHQDWSPVVIGKTKGDNVKKDTARKQVISTTSSATNKPAWKIEQQVDSDVGKPIKYVSKEDSNKIIKARVTLKLSQKDLAQRLNMQVKEIHEVESGKAVENKAILSKIKRFLKI
jgi:ribosome-binding protein aMBF1 (putative translation factor)